MIELAQHIETLLLDNDCVIIPNLGGFIAHYTPASFSINDGIFFPPTRVIGFNPSLKINDGLLVQSYASVYGTSFSDATKIVERKVAELISDLHENGKVDLPNVGELLYSMHGVISFKPYDHKLATPDLYGLNELDLQPLDAIQQPIASIKPAMPITTQLHKQRRRSNLRIKQPHLTNVLAMLLMITLFFVCSTPIKNTEIIQENYAQILPSELFNQQGEQSLLIKPVSNNQHPNKSKLHKAPITVKVVKVKHVPTTAKMGIKKKSVTQITKQTAISNKQTAKSTALPQSTPSNTLRYHIIVASVGTAIDAQVLAAQLKAQGYEQAQAIIGKGKMRVSIQSFATQEEAYTHLNRIRQADEKYQTAWILKN